MTRLRDAMILVLCVGISLALAQRGDQKGETQVPPVPKEAIPPAPALTPMEGLRSIQLKPGFSVELVASEPLVEDPVAMAFDPDGGLWVVEMRGFMPNVDGKGEADIPGRVVYLRDTDGDGRMDGREVFLDDLVMPRAVALAYGGVLVAEPPHLWFCRDTNGDHVCDEKTELAGDYGRQGNPEHTANGLLWALDNWIYSASCTARFRKIDGIWAKAPTSSRGQWGIAQDDYGRLFFNSNSDQLRADLVPSSYISSRPRFKLPGLNVRVANDQSTYPARVNPGVNRGYRPGTLRADGTLASFTAACAPCIYRDEVFPEEFEGNAFVCEPSGNLIKRNIIQEKDGLLTARPAYKDSEFLASTDERFRPVNLYSGPDGALYVVDMYHGILQHRVYVTSYLRGQILDRQLEQPLHQGRIYRVVYQGKRRTPRPRLDQSTPPQLAGFLSHPNGWVRDTAQRLLIEQGAASVAPVLRSLVQKGKDSRARLHALWTLEGLAMLAPELLVKALADSDPKIRAAALRLSEPFLSDTAPRAAQLLVGVYQMAEDPAPEVQLQLALTLGEVNNPVARGLLSKIKENGKPLAQELATHSLREDTQPAQAQPARPEMTAQQKAQFELGRGIFEAACLACHQANGQGQEGLAPPLVGSQWVGRSADFLARIVLHGLRGPIDVDSQTYQLEMPALGVLNDEQIAAALSYIRQEWGHRFEPITADAVKEVRNATTDRGDAWTIEELSNLE